MKNILKKNQLMITALAIMIAVAGYLHFAGESLEGEDYVATAGEAQTLDEVEVENFTAGNVTDDYSLEGLFDLSEEDLTSGQLTEIESLDADVTEIVDNYLDEGMDTAQVVEGAETAATIVTEGVETPAEGEIPGEAVFTGTTSVTTLSEARLLKEQVRAKNKETLLEIINSTTLSDEQKQNAVDTMVEMTAIAEQEMSAEILLEAKGFTDVVVSISDGSVDVVVNEPELTDAERAQIEDIVKRKTNVEAENIVISTVVQ